VYPLVGPSVGAPASPAGYFGSRMMLGAGRVAIAHDVDELLDDLDS
jgi:hypothetical protein